MAPRFYSILVAACLAVAFIGNSTGPVSAQYSEEKLVAFVDAAIEVEGLMTKRDEAVATASSPEEVAEIRRAAEMDMTMAVENAPDITVDEYLEINRLSREDPALMKQILELYGEAVSGSGGAQ
jgi:hypothetical protein